jgi:serine/threonine protein kinase
MSQLSEDIGYQIWMDISSGMEYLHANHIVHLDIKAENILLSERCQAKICDFRYSVQHAIKPIPFNGGIPTYTPLEFVLSGNRWRPADIWGSGLVMGSVLGIWQLQPAGNWRIADIRHKPGPATKMLEWFDKVERSKERIPDKHSLLLKMLANDPSKRITSSDLVKNLRALPQVKALTGELLL